VRSGFNDCEWADQLTLISRQLKFSRPARRRCAFASNCARQDLGSSHGQRVPPVGVEELVPIVYESYKFLAAQNDIIVLECAGSPAEINLKAHDIVNMRMAELANPHCLLVGEIDSRRRFRLAAWNSRTARAHRAPTDSRVCNQQVSW
jgi:hypothetical protein